MTSILIIQGNYIKSTPYGGFIIPIHYCSMHTLIIDAIKYNGTDRSKTVAYVEEIVKITNSDPNFLKACKKFLQNPTYSAIHGCISYSLLELTLNWLKDGVDYENDDPNLFGRELILSSGQKIKYKIKQTVRDIYNLIRTHNCTCQFEIHISQEICQFYPVGGRIDLVCEIVRQECLINSSASFDIDECIKEAFRKINSECIMYTPIKKKSSELPKHVRTIVNDKFAERNNYETRVYVDQNNNFIKCDVYNNIYIHKTEIESTSVSEIAYDNLNCRLCDSHIVYVDPYIILDDRSNGMRIEHKSNSSVLICENLCKKLLIYFMPIDRHTCLKLRRIISKLFLLYDISTQINFPRDILKLVYMMFLNVMRIPDKKVDL